MTTTAPASPPSDPPAAGGRDALLPSSRRPASLRYSVFVRAAKVALPSVAVILLLSIVLWPQMQATNDHDFNIGFARDVALSDHRQKLVNARFFGSDKDRQPYSVTAEVAEETEPGSRVVRLTHPQADITTNNGAWILGSAREGLFAQEHNTLSLIGDVSLFHDKGYELHTEQVSIDLKTMVAVGTSPLRGQGDFGELSSEGFRISDRGQTIQLTGKSRVVLWQKKEETAPPPKAPPKTNKKKREKKVSSPVVVEP